MNIKINDWNFQVDDKIMNEIKKLDEENLLAPSFKDIFRAFELTKKDDVKVIILGQDPYPIKGDASGLAFSFENKQRPNYLPKSLINIFKELEDDLNIYKQSGDLSNWAKQGVLLLNTALTTEVGKMNAHKHLKWKIFSFSLLKEISEERKNLVFILLGNNAQNFVKTLDLEDHLILCYPHPSPLAAYRGFFGSKIFSQTNNYLKENGIEEINWEI